MPEASVGGAMVKVLRLNGDATILLTTLGGSPSLTVITPTGKADERMVARGLAVSPLPGAAELHLEVLPPVRRDGPSMKLFSSPLNICSVTTCLKSHPVAPQFAFLTGAGVSFLLRTGSRARRPAGWVPAGPRGGGVGQGWRREGGRRRKPPARAAVFREHRQRRGGGGDARRRRRGACWGVHLRLGPRGGGFGGRLRAAARALEQPPAPPPTQIIVCRRRCPLLVALNVA